MFATDWSTDILQAESVSPELISWDFLQDVDFGSEPELGGSLLAPLSAKDNDSSTERYKQKNRKAQKLRERRKARTHVVSYNTLVLR